MKATVIPNYTSWVLRLLFFIFCSCSEDDSPVQPITQSKYNIPTSVLNTIFTEEQLPAEEMLDKIKKNGMLIHEGTTPPPVYSFNGTANVGLSFTMEHTCIYDDKAASNVGTVYGQYEQTIAITPNPDGSFAATLNYSSTAHPDYPQYPANFDHGSGTGYATGNGNDFTLFFKIINGVYDKITYDAIWMISGTVSNFPDVREVSNITKCLVMLRKDKDPDDKVANPGTIRIFRDAASTWNQPEVVITNIVPDSEIAGNIVLINGSGFDGTPNQNVVRFGTVEATVRSATSTQLTVVVPPGPALGGTVPVTVQVKSKTSNSITFTYPQPEVVITSITPNASREFAEIVIIGSGFSSVPTENLVRFGSVPATVQGANTTRLIVVIPAKPEQVSTVPVTVQVKSKVSNSVNFSYLFISGFNPLEGVCGQNLTLNGYGFSAVESENLVRFDDVLARVLQASPNQLIVEVPRDSKESGPRTITIQVNNATAKADNTYSYLGCLAIDSFTPNSGRCGNIITINGFGFSSTPNLNIVRFNGAQATVNTASPTVLTVFVPLEGSDGPITVEVNGRIAQSPGNFTYTGFCIGFIQNFAQIIQSFG